MRYILSCQLDITSREEKTMTITMTETTETIITENFAVELTRTGRGIIAEVVDSTSAFNGIDALGSTPRCALAALNLKIQRMQLR